MTFALLTNINITLLLAILSGTPASATLANTVQADRGGSLFGVSVSPDETHFAYFHSDDDEGEVLDGILEIDSAVRGLLQHTIIKQVSGRNDISQTLWISDDSLIVVAVDGLYSITIANNNITPKLMMRGTFKGLGYDNTTSVLALWQWNSSNPALCTYHLNSGGKVDPISRWPSTYRYASDPFMPSIVFDGHTHSLYAQTFDKANQVPVYKFDVTGGNIHSRKVLSNALGLKVSNGSVFALIHPSSSQVLSEVIDVSSNSRLAIKVGQSSWFSDFGNALITFDPLNSVVHIVNSNVELACKARPLGKLSNGLLAWEEDGEIVEDASCPR